MFKNLRPDFSIETSNRIYPDKILELFVQRFSLIQLTDIRETHNDPAFNVRGCLLVVV